MNSVFLFVDLLEDFFARPPLSERRSSICKAVNELTEFARKRDFPIVWIRQEFQSDLSDAYISMRDTGNRITIKGTGGSNLLSELNRSSDDFEIVKKRYSGFFGTGLEGLLAKLRCNKVILCGVNTHACVRATAVDAFQKDYRVVLASDAISSYDEQYHRESMRYLEQSIGKVMNNAEIRNHLAIA